MLFVAFSFSDQYLRIRTRLVITAILFLFCKRAFSDALKNVVGKDFSAHEPTEQGLFWNGLGHTL